MTDELSAAIDAAYPPCPRCGARLDDAGGGFDPEHARLRCPICGLDVIAGQ